MFISPTLSRFFQAELANYDAMRAEGDDPHPATIETAVDSYLQAPDVFGLPQEDVEELMQLLWSHGPDCPLAPLVSGHQAETQYAADVYAIQRFAAANGGAFDPQGSEVGFGRPCVGVTVGHTYPDFDPNDPAVAPPEGVDHAYHKHNCLCVLGTSMEAVGELATWVRHLERNRVTIYVSERKPEHAIDAMLHGFQSVRLVTAPQREVLESAVEEEDDS